MNKRAENETRVAKVRLTLDSELIADLEVDDDTIKGGLSGSAPPRSLSGSGSVGTVMVAGGGRSATLEAGC